MRRFSAFSALLASFFSRDLYRDVAHSWRGVGFLYLVLICVLTWAPNLIKMHLVITHAAESEWPQLVKNFPEIKLEKGIVTSTVAQPFTMMDDSKPPKAGFVLDTTGQIKSLEETPATILVTRTRVYARDAGNKQERGFDLKAIPDVTINAAKLTEWGRLVAKWFGLAAFVGVTFGSVIWGVIAMMLLAVIGAMVGGPHSTVSTTGYLRLAAVARSPALILDSIFSFTRLSIPMWSVASFGVTIAYMIYAVTCANEVPAKSFDAVVPPPPEPFGQTCVPPVAQAQEPSCFAAPPSDEPPQA